MRLRLFMAVAVLVLAGCSTSGGSDEVSEAAPTTTEAEATTTEPPATTEAPATTEPAAEAITLTGAGQTNTDPMQLTSERYAVAYDFPGACFYSATLQSTDPDAFVYEGLGSGEAVSGETNVFGLGAGEYFVEVITGSTENCPWSITLTPG